MKFGTPPLQSPRLLDQVCKRARHKHYSRKTEKADLYWLRFYIRWSVPKAGITTSPHES